MRAVTLYGADNGIDGLVLDVLIRKHRTITAQAGCGPGADVQRIGAAGARGKPPAVRSTPPARAAPRLARPALCCTAKGNWCRSLHRTRAQRSAPSTGDVPDVVEHLELLIPAIDDELGRPRDIASFVARVFTRLGVPVQPRPENSRAPQSPAPGVRAALGVADTAHQDLVFRRDLPAGPHSTCWCALIQRCAR